MERGTLSVLRQTAKGPVCNFQRWDGSRHRSEYIPADQVPVVEANLERYKQFQSVVDQYVEVVSRKSREERLAGVKKNDRPRNRPCPGSRNSRPDLFFFGKDSQRVSRCRAGNPRAGSRLQTGQRAGRHACAAGR